MKTHKYVNHEKEKALNKYSQKATHTSQKIEPIKMPTNQQMVNTMGKKKMSQESGAYLQHYLGRDRQISGGQPGLHSIFQDSQGYTGRSFLNKIKQQQKLNYGLSISRILFKCCLEEKSIEVAGEMVQPPVPLLGYSRACNFSSTTSILFWALWALCLHVWTHRQRETHTHHF